VGNDVVVVLILVLVIALVWRGPKNLPEIGRMFGRGIREARAEAAKLRPDNDDTPKDSDSAAT
jgi:Sec-independent protein translocase protein TatA